MKHANNNEPFSIDSNSHNQWRTAARAPVVVAAEAAAEAAIMAP